MNEILTRTLRLLSDLSALEARYDLHPGVRRALPGLRRRLERGVHLQVQRGEAPPDQHALEPLREALLALSVLPRLHGGAQHLPSGWDHAVASLGGEVQRWVRVEPGWAGQVARARSLVRRTQGLEALLRGGHLSTPLITAPLEVAVTLWPTGGLWLLWWRSHALLAWGFRVPAVRGLAFELDDVLKLGLRDDLLARDAARRGQRPARGLSGA